MVEDTKGVLFIEVKGKKVPVEFIEKIVEMVDDSPIHDLREINTAIMFMAVENKSKDVDEVQQSIAKLGELAELYYMWLSYGKWSSQ